MDNKAVKKRYLLLVKVCEALWDEFDPIGVYDDDMEDFYEEGFVIEHEYSSEAPETVKLVLAGADEDQLRSYIKDTWEDLTTSKPPPSEVDAFVKKLAALIESEREPGAQR